MLAELLEEEVDEVVGPKGKHGPDRAAVRHGREAGEVTLGGRRVHVERPRVRSADGQSELQSDGSVWAVTCFVTRMGYRRRAISYALAAVDFARQCGARALEGDPITRKDVLPGELHVGTRSGFAAAGIEVSRPTLRWVVMRIDF